MSNEESLTELLTLTDDLLEVALLMELLLPCFPRDGVPEKALHRLSDYLTQHAGDLQALSRRWRSHASRGRI